jgi:hypothetical protein
VATSLNCGYPLWLDDETFNGLLGRTYDVGTTVYTGGTATTVQIPSGVFPSAGNAMQVNAASGMNVTVNAGFCVVANSSSAAQGAYKFGLMTQGTLQIAAADQVNPRIDLVVAYVIDEGSSGSASYVAVITGTPVNPPVAPTNYSNSMILAQITVPANVTSASGMTIADQRTYVVAPGGILPIAGPTAAPAGYPGQVFFDLTNSRFCSASGTAGVVNRLSVLPWQPQMSVITSAVSDSSGKGTLQTITSVSVTTDGFTNLEVYYKWAGISVTGIEQVTLSVAIDGTEVDYALEEPIATNVADCGGSILYYTATPPSAASHTVTYRFQGASSSYTCTIEPNMVLRVSPVVV